MGLNIITEGVWGATQPHRWGPLRFDARMTVVRLKDGLWIHSPIPIDDALAEEIDALGTVRHLVAPSLYHHCYLNAASTRWPEATVWAPAKLREKVPDLRIDQVLAESTADEWRGIDLVKISGAPHFTEWVFLHKASKTLIVTDLVTNLREVNSWFTRLVFRVEGVWNRVAQSPMWGWITKDRTAARAACREMLAWDFERVVVAHGEIMDGPSARADLEAALHRMLGGPKSLGSYV